jgi:hypothetical protein
VEGLYEGKGVGVDGPAVGIEDGIENGENVGL